MPDPRRRSVPRTLAAGLLALGAACAPGAPADPGDLVLIVVDTLRADHVLDPENAVATPNIDALAADGVGFTRAFSHAPMTLPAHTSLFASRLPHETGVRVNAQTVPEDVPLVAEYLERLGYDTRAVISIWTLGGPERTWGIERGFRTYDREYFGLLPPAPDTQARLERALDGLGADAPFFLFAHYSDPHLPYNDRGNDRGEDRAAADAHEVELRFGGERIDAVATARMATWEVELAVPPGETELVLEGAYPFSIGALELDPPGAVAVVPDVAACVFGRTTDNYLKLATKVRNPSDATVACRLKLWIHDEPSRAEKRARYPREVEFVDHYVGQLLDELRRRGLYDSSLIVFTSDHGEALGEHDWWGHNENLYDELLHVPLIVKLPAGHPRAAALEEQRDAVVRHLDLVPTALEVLGLPALPGQRGTSLFAGGDRVLVATTHQPRREHDLVALRDARYKLVYTVQEDRFELLDLEADPAELEDVFAARPDARPDWPQRLRALAAELGAIEQDMTPSDVEAMGKLGYLGGDDDAAPTAVD